MKRKPDIDKNRKKAHPQDNRRNNNKNKRQGMHTGLSISNANTTSHENDDDINQENNEQPSTETIHDTDSMKEFSFLKMNSCMVTG